MKARPFKNTEVVSTEDGEFTLHIDMEVIDALEDEFDCGFDEITQSFQGKVRMGKVSRLVRGLLSRHHPNLSLDDTAALFMAYGEAFGDGMSRLFARIMPEEAKAKNPPKPRRGTRKNSSAPGAVPA